MTKPITPKIHGIIDYLSVPVLLLAGPLFGFDALPAKITSTLAGVVLVYSAATAYPPGLVKLLSLNAHRVIDIILAIGLIAAPWLFHFEQPSARWFFVAMGLVSLLVVSMTDFSRAATGPKARLS
jgi:hypothetical protein